MKQHCPKCGYTVADEAIHHDHHLCDGEIPAPTSDETGGHDMKQAIEHDQFDAIVMSLSAIALMANTRYDIWRAYAERHARGEVDLKQNIDRDSEAIRKLCSLLDEAMQYIGEVNNRTDAVDDHGMTDAAFEAMDRALERQEATT